MGSDRWMEERWNRQQREDNLITDLRAQLAASQQRVADLEAALRDIRDDPISNGLGNTAISYWLYAIRGMQDIAHRALADKENDNA